MSILIHFNCDNQDELISIYSHKFKAYLQMYVPPCLEKEMAISFAAALMQELLVNNKKQLSTLKYKKAHIT